MNPFKLLVVFLLFFSNSTYGQNRVFERPALTGRSIFMDRGAGNTYIAREHRFGFDSTHVHLLSANSDMELTHLGGYRLLANLTWLNDGAKVHDGVILGGANLAFSTLPYVLRMDTSGNVLYSSYFSNLTDGQEQIISTFVEGDDLDLFTWANNTRLSYYMLNGSIDGSFPSGLQVHAPEGIEFRTDDIVPTENPNEYMVLCQADTVNSLNQFLIVMRINPEGVLWSYLHDYSNNENIVESVFSFKKLVDGNWMYIAIHGGENSPTKRIVKIDGDGTVLWSKEYFLNGESLSIGDYIETEDNGFLMAASLWDNAQSFILKLDSEGTVLWSKVYVPSLIETAPFGAFFENAQNQKYSYSSTMIAEIDEVFDVCDMEPHSGITATEVFFDIVPISHNTTEIVPEYLDMPFELRADTFENTLSCLSTGIEDESDERKISLYPNPAYESLYVALSNFQSEVELSIFDVQGRTVKSESVIVLDNLAIDVSQMNAGVYVLRIESPSKVIQTRFVKE